MLIFGRVPIERPSGCNRVLCKLCNKNFCWLCLELTGGENKSHLVKYKHWTDITKKNKCKLWGGTRKKIKIKNDGDMVIVDMENGAKK